MLSTSISLGNIQEDLTSFKSILKVNELAAAACRNKAKGHHTSNSVPEENLRQFQLAQKLYTIHKNLSL